MAAITEQLVCNGVGENRTLFRSIGAPSESVECLPSQATGVGEINAFNSLFSSLSAVLVKMVNIRSLALQSASVGLCTLTNSLYFF